ncbi:MAG: YjbF family lipoprotein [Gammaproteobacteria bacterium]
MDSWIKIICILSISSCSSLNTEFLKKSQPLSITDEIKDSQYAMQFIEVDNEFEEIFLLSGVRGSTQTWFKGRDIFVITKQGKITKTIGLENDFEILSYSGFESFNDSKSTISFNNPKSGYMDIFFSYKLVKEGTMKKIINDEEFNYKLVEETFTVPLIRWKGKNYYWIDSDNDIWMSKQSIDPFGKKARVTVLKKYSD